MPQFDAGPGEWSDRPWEDPERKPKPQARRRGLTLPPWALLAILVAVVIILCVLLVLLVQGLRGGDEEGQSTPLPSATAVVSPSATVSLVTPTSGVAPTNTVVLPVGTPEATSPPTAIGPSALVVVQGTKGAGLNLRQQPTTYAKVVSNAREETVLTVLEGPKEADGYTWWRVRAPDGTEGWVASEWLVLKTE
jgi:hypothetical protein